MLRALIAGLYAVFGVIFSMPAHWHFASLAKKDPKKAWLKSSQYVRGFFKNIMFLSGTKVDVRGLENLPDENTGVLFLANHRSYFDIIILQAVLGRPVGFVAKKELKKIPLFHYFMSDIGCVYLNRQSPREAMKSIKEATDNLANGLNMTLFPEGTRNKGTDLLPFKEGGYRIAEKAKAPMVLVAMTGNDQILEANKGFTIKARHVTLEFSKPYYIADMTREERKEFYSQIPSKIADMLKTHAN